ncbi:IS630 family transposase ISAzo30 [Pararobbsia alpina]|uniref:IS630 family transposase ISAzo30 n=1 Tax=Pararobbsia alpina TaxID=621374 RepID=A0A6S7D3U8_9BURK|nr:IS630 family transposase ISAzo30 [Pararobbsia alpina]
MRVFRKRFCVSSSHRAYGGSLEAIEREGRISTSEFDIRSWPPDPEAIERWQRDTYPAIVRQAREENADIFFWDESGFRADSVHGRTWAQRGETPVVERPGQRQSMSAASAVNSKRGFLVCNVRRWAQR